MKRVTIQDIAEELGLSRNTISKVINNSGGVAEATRERVLKKAVDMGYKQFTYLSGLSDLIAETSGTYSGRTDPETEIPDTADRDTARQNDSVQNAAGKEIVVLTAKRLTSSHFAFPMLDRFRQEIGNLGYLMRVCQIQQGHQPSVAAAPEPFVLPPDFRREHTAAVVCIEVFDRWYAEKVCALGLPTLFIDGPAVFYDGSLPADQLYMENSAEIIRLMNELISQGRKKIGFVGNYAHCQSFLERYLAFRTVMMFHGIPVNEDFCIHSNQRETIIQRVRDMDPLPDVFLCANDFKAIDVLDALREMGKSVPEDVLLCGFDDSPESRRMMPPLTTIHIHTQIMASSAVQLLVSRIREPNLDYRIMHTQTDLIRRESTEWKQKESSL